MKFNRYSLKSWVTFSRAAFNVIIASLLVKMRLLKTRNDQITLTGHQYNGNIKSLHKYLRQHHSGKVHFCRLQSTTFGHTAELSITSLRQTIEILRSACIVTDHGPSVFTFAIHMGIPIKWVDVWHGIGFKDVSDSYRKNHENYDLVLSPSTWYSDNFLIKRCNIAPQRIYESGYCLLDELNKGTENDTPNSVKKFKKFILYAPTWHNNTDATERSLDTQKILKNLNDIAERYSAGIIYRAHLNDEESNTKLNNVISLPMTTFPDTLSLMKGASGLITDWSSISIDFACLNKPIIHLETPPPFGDNFLLQPNDRPGEICSNYEEIKIAIEKILSGAENCLDNEHHKILQKTHGDFLDGRCSERAHRAIKALIAS